MSADQLNFAVLAPLGFTAIGSLLVLLGEVLLSRRKTFFGREVTEAWIGSVLAVTSIVFLALALYASISFFLSGTSQVFNEANPMVRLDAFSSLATSLIALASLLACMLSIHFLVELRINHGEYYALLLLASCGMMLLVAAVDMMTIFLGVELMSIPIYVLAGFDRRKLRSNEASLKYFLIGAFASAILLYGMALLYGATGSTSLEGIRAGFVASNALALCGLGLVIVGFAFKISSVPFHQWTPDVYEGAPTPVTAYMSVAVKAAAFVALLRVVVVAFGAESETLVTVLWALSALTMVVGNLMAVIQDNVKRMLAYSSIAHAGYILVGFVAGSPEGYAAVIFYLIVYIFMNLGAFGVIAALAHRGREADRFEDFTGLARSRPAMAALMTLFMLALAGIPGTGGFIAKFNIFAAAVAADAIWLTLIGVLMSVVSVYYYLRLPVVMYMQEAAEELPWRELASGTGLVLGICAFAVIFLGIFPNQGVLPLLGDVHVLDWARQSIKPLF